MASAAGAQGDVDALRELGERARLRRRRRAADARRDGRADLVEQRSARAVAHGDLERARAALGPPLFGSRGVVVPGEQRGRDARLSHAQPRARRRRASFFRPTGYTPSASQTPRGRFGGMMNLGGRPTFGDRARSLEVHLFDATAIGTAIACRRGDSSPGFATRCGSTASTRSSRSSADDADDARRALTQA